MLEFCALPTCPMRVWLISLFSFAFFQFSFSWPEKVIFLHFLVCKDKRARGSSFVSGPLKIHFGVLGKPAKLPELEALLRCRPGRGRAKQSVCHLTKPSCGGGFPGSVAKDCEGFRPKNSLRLKLAMLNASSKTHESKKITRCMCQCQA